MSELNENTVRIICVCGFDIPIDDVSYTNKCSEEGEDYGEVSAECPRCKRYFEASQWGEWEDEADAISYLSNYINELKQQ